MAFTMPSSTGRVPQVEDTLIASTSSRRHLDGTIKPTVHRCFTTTGNHQRCKTNMQKCQVTRQEREAQQIKAEEEEEEAQRGGFASGASRFGNLVNTLLFGAASRIERGTSVCVPCRGNGTVLCPDCGVPLPPSPFVCTR